MGIKYDSRYCTQCKEQKKASIKTPNHILHLLLSVLTFGIWIIVWMILSSGADLKSWRCETCGGTETFKSKNHYDKKDDLPETLLGKIFFAVGFVLTLIAFFLVWYFLFQTWFG